MKREFIRWLTAISVVFCARLANASLRESQRRIPDDIVELTHSTFGNDFIVRGYVVLDSVLTSGKVRDFNYSQFTDPYGTLKGSTIFWVRRTRPESFYTDPNLNSVDTSIVCIMKNGSIAWHSSSEIFGEVDELLFCFDLNKSGKVDIGLEVEEFMKQDIYFLYMISWDGTSGQFISDIDQSNRSVIVSCSGIFDVFDLNNDGNYEIRGEWGQDVKYGGGWFPTNNLGPTAPFVIYGWNGNKFGFWPGVTQVPGYKFLPANRIKLVSHCSVSENNGLFQYSYTFKSDSSSMQLIDEIFIENIDTADATGFGPWVSMYSWILDSYHWSALTLHTNQMLRAGEEKAGFGLLSSGMPVIKTVYAQGLAPLGNIMNDKVTDDVIVNDLETNSYQTKTIGPGRFGSQLDVGSFLDTLTSYTTQSLSLNWIKDQGTADKYSSYFASAKTSLEQDNIAATRSTLQRVLQEVDADSSSNLTSEAYALIRYNTEYLLAQLPVPSSGFIVKLINSSGTNLTGGSLHYYEGSWKDAMDNNDGTFTINTTSKTLSLRMTYQYGTETKSNVTVGPDTAVFQTVNTQAKLEDSKGTPLDTGTVQYYAGAWKTFGTTTRGVTMMELLPGNYTFRLTYAYGSNDKQQNIGTNPTVVFRTVNASVELQNSQGNPIDTGTVQYYAGAWRKFGVTTNGVATMQLLPNNYAFRMTHAYASNDKQQNIGTNPAVVFRTVNATVQLRNSSGSLIDSGTVQYYAGAWRSFGVTTDGTATKELLPNNYTFRMTYQFVSNDKGQDISVNQTVSFSTLLCTIQVNDSLGRPVNDIQASYYSGAWRSVGATIDGEVTRELLPANLTFRITYGTNHQDKTQNLSANNVVTFTVQQ